MKRKHRKPWGVLVAIVLGIAVGSFLRDHPHTIEFPFFPIFDTLGKVFLNALTLVVVPLVFSSIISGIARIGQEGSLGRLGFKMAFFYLSTNVTAILLGLLAVNLINPGANVSLPSPEGLSLSIQDHLASREQITFTSMLVSIVPSNILKALSHGEMLGLIFFSLLFGYAISKIESETSSNLRTFFLGVFQTMIEITHIIMRFLPYGVFCLVAKVFMTTSGDSLRSVALFGLAVLLGLSMFTFIALPLFLKGIAKVSPLRHFKAMSPALVTAFSTSSSSASLPITIDCVEKRAGVSHRICSLVVPLGTSINMCGSALYECVAALFIAQAYNIQLSFTTQFLTVVLSLLASFGVAGVPSGSLIAVLLILKALGLPQEGIGLIMAVDRLLDMCRTTTNVFADSCCAVLVAKSEGEKGVLVQDPVDNY
jgi:Na+/H+-dicarboxylate symporter